MSSKGSLQSILFDFWPEEETPALKSSSNLLSFLNVTHIFSSLSFFFIQRKSETMFQNQEVKLKYRIVVYRVQEVAGEIYDAKICIRCRYASSTKVC